MASELRIESQCFHLPLDEYDSKGDEYRRVQTGDQREDEEGSGQGDKMFRYNSRASFVCDLNLTNDAQYRQYLSGQILAPIRQAEIQC